MKILIINPNSDPDMTRMIQATADDYSGGDFEVQCKPTPGAPVFIETYEDVAKAAPGMIPLLRENEAEFDGFIIACHSDPNLDVMKEIAEWNTKAFSKFFTFIGGNSLCSFFS